MSTIQKSYYIGDYSSFPEIQNGNILYATDSDSLYIDINNERKCIIPRMGTVVSYNVADKLGNTKDIPMTYQINSVLQNLQKQIENINNRVNRNTVKIHDGKSGIWLENPDSSIDVISLICNLDDNAYVRIINFNAYFDMSFTEYIVKIDKLFNKIPRLKGIDENGVLVSNSVINGTISVPILTNQIINQYNSYNPDIKLIASSIYDYMVKYVKAPEDSDGSNEEVIGIEFFHYGDMPFSFSPDVKTSKENSDMYEFTGFTPEITNVYNDTTYTAVFKDNRPMTLKYFSKDIEEYTSNEITSIGAYAFCQFPKLRNVTISATQIGINSFGYCSSLSKVDLTNTSEEILIGPFAFSGCSNLKDLIIRSNSKVVCQNSVSETFNNTLISKNIGVVYVQPELIDSYNSDTDSWGKYIIKSIDDYPFDPIGNQWEEVVNNKTTYATDYQIGKTCPIVYQNTIYNMELIAFDTDDKADGSGKARMTWICTSTITTYYMKSNDLDNKSWVDSDLRTWLRNGDVWDCLPQILKDNIVEVNKTYYDNREKKTKTSTETIWIPSVREIFGPSYEPIYEDSGIDYTNTFVHNNNRNYYWLRTSEINDIIRYKYVSTGTLYSQRANSYCGIVPCFCI